MTSKAVIMVGGSSRGTRFRPLALDQAKILFPIAGKPLLSHTIDAVLKIEAITEILLIGFYDPSIFTEFISSFNARMKYQKRNCVMKYLKEFKALGTAGGLYYFKDEIMKGNPESFLVIHGDIVCSFPLQDIIDFYEAKQGLNGKLDAVLLGVKPSDYDLFMALNDSDKSSLGVIVSDKATGKVVHYVENPETKLSNIINGGIYLFNDHLFRRLANAKITKLTTLANDVYAHEDEDIISMEKDILRNLPEFGNTYVYEYRGFWKAIKTPADALTANQLYLEKIKREGSSLKQLASPATVAAIPLHRRTDTVDRIVLQPASINIVPPVFIHPSAQIDYSQGTKIGPYVSIGENTVIGAGSRLSNSILLNDVTIGKNSLIRNSIISYNASIGNWSRIEGTGVDINSITEIVKKKGAEKYKEVMATHESFKVIGIKDSGNISILGSGNNVCDDVYLLNSFILPNKSIKHDVKYEIIM